MNSEESSDLVRRIHLELDEIQIVLTRIHDKWNDFRRLSDDAYLDSVALNLHGFYMGFERVFAQIAETVDGKTPSGGNWHELLLSRMLSEVPRIRPAVISPETGVCWMNYAVFAMWSVMCTLTNSIPKKLKG